MIFTITLNPAFDKTLQCEDFQVAALNRVLSSREDIGGKGINVSKIIRLLGGHSKAMGFLGEIRSKDFLNFLDDLQIEHDFVLIPDAVTRTNLKIIDVAQHTLTELNESGFAVSDAKKQLLLENLSRQLTAEDIVILSGSVPKQSPDHLYADFIKEIQKKTQYILVDTSGENLREAIALQPFFVKPNLVELQELIGVEINTQEKLFTTVETLLAQGIKHLLISMGAAGSYYFTKGRKVKIHPIKVDVVSPVGAGDSQVAAFAYAMVQHQSMFEMLHLVSAVSSAMVTTSGTDLPSLDLIDSLYGKVRLEEQ